ncbi:MAG: hypothetical protein ACYTBV_17875 [Planctomycetota bacterium]|jgi:hypothetical protein
MKTADKFVFGDFFAEVKCRFGHKVRMFNIDRGHFVACDKCRAYTFVGSKLMSNWQEEDDDTWQKNQDSIKGYKFIK